jgi:pilus assembly protein Flp/PilA
MLSAINGVVLRVFVLYKDQEGQALAEYGMILGLVAVVAITALNLVGSRIIGKLGTINVALGGSGSS